MSSEPLSFFTLDRGTATTAASLIGVCDGRFRLLASGVVPSGADPEGLLEDLVERVSRTEPTLVSAAGEWRDWARIEARSLPPARVVIAAASPVVARSMELAFGAAGWDVVGTSSGPRPDALSLAEWCVDPTVACVAIGVSPEPAPEEREASPALWDLVVALASMRDDLTVIACGPTSDRPDGLPEGRLQYLPHPDTHAAVTESPLRDAARRLIPTVSGMAKTRSSADSRQGQRIAIASLAALLGRRVEGVDVGASAGSRTLAHPHGEVAHLASVSGALVPQRVLSDDAEAEAVLRWSTLRGDPGGHLDRLRNMRLAPFREAWGDGAHLRLAALRAALSRLEDEWMTGLREAGDIGAAADILVLSGGAVASIPPPAAALAVVDTLRRPGVYAMLQDHARILGPLGLLPDEGDRRRLLADLLDDAFLPLGSAMMTGELRMVGRAAGLMLVTSPLAQQQVQLVPGTLRLVDLPPGISARVDLQSREGHLFGTRTQRASLEVSGGLAGLLVDTREIPLKLPESADRRRSMLAAWEAVAWPAGAVQ